MGSALSATTHVAAGSPLDAPEPIRLLGHTIHRLSGQDVIDRVLSALNAHRGGWIATHNLDHLRRLHCDPDFARLCDTASLRTADGKPLLWAAALKGTPLPERVAGSDLVLSLTKAAADAGRSVFLLGGNEGTAEKAAAALSSRFRQLRIAGTYFPPFGYDKSLAEMERLTNAVAHAQPDITYVALGSPRQERLIQRLLQVHPTGWYIGVGISLSFITGEVRRAPLWMQQTGLEWLHRLAQEPTRLARRYLVDGLPFAARLLISSALQRS